MGSLCVFLLAVPVLMGLVGIVWLLNLFGATDAETRFYRGREFWFPILPGDDRATHRFVGGILVVIAIVFGALLPRFC